MKGWNSNRWGFWNKILAGVCVVVAVALAVFLLSYRNSERERTTEIVQIAALSEKKSQTAEDGQQSVETGMETGETAEEAAQAEAGDTSAETAQVSSENQDTTISAEQEENTEALAGISWRGDEFLSGEEIDTLSAPALLEQWLQEEGYEIPVENFSLTGAGTLSQLRLAGVAEQEIEGYVEAHTEEADGEVSQMETGIREFSEEELERSDQSYLPVIFMGYYGGWSNDPAELNEQIQLILDTYESPEEYVILGLHPVSGGVNPEGYQQVMEDTWGEHYIDLPEVLGDATAASYDGQERIADAVFEKLTELGYLM